MCNDFLEKQKIEFKAFKNVLCKPLGYMSATRKHPRATSNANRMLVLIRKQSIAFIKQSRYNASTDCVFYMLSSFLCLKNTQFTMVKIKKRSITTEKEQCHELSGLQYKQYKFVATCWKRGCQRKLLTLCILTSTTYAAVST